MVRPNKCTGPQRCNCPIRTRSYTGWKLIKKVLAAYDQIKYALYDQIKHHENLLIQWILFIPS